MVNAEFIVCVVVDFLFLWVDGAMLNCFSGRFHFPGCPECIGILRYLPIVLCWDDDELGSDVVREAFEEQPLKKRVVDE